MMAKQLLHVVHHVNLGISQFSARDYVGKEQILGFSEEPPHKVKPLKGWSCL